MTSSKKPDPPPEMPPAPTPIIGRETDEAGKKARGKGRGRPSTILAGRLMQRIGNIGKRILG